MRILYFCPDFPQPSGGIKTLYRHVELLCRLGYDAYIVHQKRDFRASWHTHEAPILWLSDRPTFSQDDVLVIPEVMHALMQQTARFAGRRIVFALSWSPTYWGLKPGQSWRDFGIEEVMTKSPLIQRYIRWSMDLEAALIPEFIHPALYHRPQSIPRIGHEPQDATHRSDHHRDLQGRGSEEAKTATLCYLPRKERSGAWLHGLFQRNAELNPLMEWMPLQNLDEVDYAARLRRARLFLTTNLQEGMNSSVLEAMACGCLVVGYTGVGGATYMVGDGSEQNSILVPNGDLPALGPVLAEVVRGLAAEPESYADIIESGVQSAARFQNREAESRALRALFT